jgi:hypothetical protein
MLCLLLLICLPRLACCFMCPQVLTKFCCFGNSMNQAKEARFVEQVLLLCMRGMLQSACLRSAGPAGHAVSAGHAVHLHQRVADVLLLGILWHGG